MTYGKSKERDMVRSILPSTRRKGARDDKRLINKARRTSVRQALRQYSDYFLVEEEHLCDSVEFYDVPDNPAHRKIADADARYDHMIKYTMWDRRLGDKVAPFQRWAATQVKDIRMLDRASWLQSKMPDTLAVRHAMSHVRFMDEFDVGYPHTRYFYHPLTPEEREWQRAAEYAQVVVDLQRICTGPLGRFNNFIPKHAYRYITKGGWARPQAAPEAPWEYVRDECNPYDRNYTREVWARPVERLQGVHHIEEWVAAIAGLPAINRGVIEEAIYKTYESTADSYWTFDERSRHGRKDKV